MPAGDSRRTPLASPPHAIGAWISATERALPWPPAAGISARRHGIVADDLRRRARGLVSVRQATELSVDALDRQRRRRDDVGDAGVVLGAPCRCGSRRRAAR